MNLGIIIAAGGIGARMGGQGSKQLMPLMGMPVLARTIAIFDGFDETREIHIAIDDSDIDRCRSEIVEAYGFKKVAGIVGGGDTRSASVRNALQHLGLSIDTVLVHDGARPLLTTEVLAGALKDFMNGSCDGVVCGLPVTDTIKEVGINSRLVTQTPDRSRLWAAQTPQIFKRETIEKAYQARPEVLAEATDDAFLVERIGGWIRMTPGSRENIKLTEPVDMVLAEGILREREKEEPE